MKKAGLVILLALIGAVSFISIYLGNKREDNVRKQNERQTKQAEIDQLTKEFDGLVNAQWSMPDVGSFLSKQSPAVLARLAELTEAKAATADALIKQLMWVSSSTITYPFKDPQKCNYHETVLIWCAKKNGIRGMDDLGSFVIERRILERKFSEIWDRLGEAQRTTLLAAMKVNGLSADDKRAIVAGSGAVALTALSATVAFSGFAFYTTMSTVLSTAAGLLGVTLPFAVYEGTAGTVACLSGPVGWGIALMAGTGAVVWSAAPSSEKTTAFILAVHALKAQRANEILARIKSLGGDTPPVRGVIMF